jgi:hypothetical protein
LIAGAADGQSVLARLQAERFAQSSAVDLRAIQQNLHCCIRLTQDDLNSAHEEGFIQHIGREEHRGADDSYRQ